MTVGVCATKSWNRDGTRRVQTQVSVSNGALAVALANRWRHWMYIIKSVLLCPCHSTARYSLAERPPAVTRWSTSGIGWGSQGPDRGSQTLWNNSNDV